MIYLGALGGRRVINLRLTFHLCTFGSLLGGLSNVYIDTINFTLFLLFVEIILYQPSVEYHFTINYRLLHIF